MTTYSNFPACLRSACRKAALVAVAAVALAGGAASAWAGDGDVFEMLRKGGYTLYFRHAQSDWRNTAAAQPAHPAAVAVNPKSATAKTASGDQSAPCAGERLLSDEGRADARALGLAVKSLNLTISDVAAANLCRMQETARIAFGAAKMVPDLAPRPGTVLSLTAQGAAVQRLARAPVPEHGVRIVVGDYEVAQALYGVTLAEGDALVLKAGADGSVEPVAKVRVGDWRLLAPVAAMPATNSQKF